VTHDQSEALTMSNRVAVFNDGVIQQLATPQDLYETPMNAFVAQFIGENNQLNGEVKDIDGQRCTIEIDGTQAIVQATPVNITEVGDRTTLSLRPERVTIRPGAGSMENIHSALVRELIYLGDHMRTRVTLLGHDDFVIKVANAAGHQHLKVGETVSVGWHAADCRALDRH
jgi:putative spermidine/putrescine transport system ATP-binding protein